MTTTVTPPRTITPPAPRSTGEHAGPVTTMLSVTRRTLLKFLRTPQLIVVGTIQGAMFLLIFRYVFGGAIHAGAVSYVDFLVPGFVATGVLFSGMGAAAGVAEDVEGGLFDRLRSLPVSRTALVGGRAVADTLLVSWGLVITTAIGFAIGFRIHGGVGSGVAALGLCVVYGFAFTWPFVCIGLFSGSAQAAQGMSLVVFPFTFVSSAYVPLNTLPGWMQPIAAHQPITPMVDAVRALCLGSASAAGLSGSTAHYVVVSLIWSAVIVAAFAPIAASRYRSS